MNSPAFIAKMEPRERKLLLALGGVLGLFLVLLLPIFIYQSVTDRRDRNAEVRDLIAQLQASQGLVADRKARREAVLARYARPAPPLAGFIEEAARANELVVPESSDKPEVPHGKRYSERIAVVKMHKIGMKAFVKMHEKIERSGYPVAVTKLNLKPRSGEADSWEVELGVSAFDRKEIKGDAKEPKKDAATTPEQEEKLP